MIKRFLMWLLIPNNTDYCYDNNGLCPFFSKICGLENSAHCSYIKDREISGIDELLLDDQCKICWTKLYNRKEHLTFSQICGKIMKRGK